VTLSFLGLGVTEPAPSWGNMLGTLQQYHVLASYWWMSVPGLALVVVFMAYSALASALQARAGWMPR
jgi:peptide/nickel transport system permease protein